MSVQKDSLPYLDLQNQQRFNQKRNINPYKGKIKEGQLLSTAQLVNLFGNQTQKNSYKENKKITQGTKQAIINKALQYCCIEDKGQGQFQIHKVLDFTLNSKLVKFLNNPEDNLFNILLLKVIACTLLEGKNNNNCLSFTLMNYAQNFSLINKNYNKLKYQKEKQKQFFLETFNIKEITFNEFYNSVDDSIKYYLLNVLDLLSDINAIALTKNLLILIRKDPDGKHFIRHRATEEEEGIITSAIDKFVSENNINYTEIYYNKKIQNKFELYMQDILKELNAVHFYRSYEAFITNTKLLQFILQYNEKDDFLNIEEYSKYFVQYLPVYYLLLNTLFVNKMIENASVRNNKRILKTIKDSDFITQILQEKNIKLKNLTLKNYKEIIDSDLIDNIQNKMISFTENQNKLKKFSNLSKTIVDEEEFNDLCKINMSIQNHLQLFKLDINNWEEGVKQEYEIFQNPQNDLCIPFSFYVDSEGEDQPSLAENCVKLLEDSNKNRC